MQNTFAAISKPIETNSLKINKINKMARIMPFLKLIFSNVLKKDNLNFRIFSFKFEINFTFCPNSNEIVKNQYQNKNAPK